MSNIEVGQVWKNRLDVELVIVAPGHHRLGVLSNDIWIAETKVSAFGGQVYVVTKKSLKDAGYRMMKEQS